MAWRHKGNPLEDLQAEMNALRKTARYYQRMVEMGVKKTRVLNQTAWEETSEMMAAGQDVNSIALSMGWAPTSFVHWVRTMTDNEITASSKALRLPFSRWGELTTGGRV